MSERHLRLTTVGGDVETARRTDPFALLGDEVEVAVGELPHHPLAGDELGGVLLRVVDVWHQVEPVSARLVGPADDVGRAPPGADVDDGLVGLLRRRVDCDGVGQVAHASILS